MSKKNSSPKSKTDWKRLDEMADEDIDFSDIPALTEEQLKSMKPMADVFAERGIEFDPSKPHIITIHHDDGSTETLKYEPETISVVLDRDVRPFFPDSEAVNRTLRSLIALMPQAEDEQIGEREEPVETTGKRIHERKSSYDSTAEDTLQRKSSVAVLPRDVFKYFPDSESVNRTLRALISLIPQPEKTQAE